MITGVLVAHSHPIARAATAPFGMGFAVSEPTSAMRRTPGHACAAAPTPAPTRATLAVAERQPAQSVFASFLSVSKPARWATDRIRRPLLDLDRPLRSRQDIVVTNTVREADMKKTLVGCLALLGEDARRSDAPVDIVIDGKVIKEIRRRVALSTENDPVSDRNVICF